MYYTLSQTRPKRSLLGLVHVYGAYEVRVHIPILELSPLRVLGHSLPMQPHFFPIPISAIIIVFVAAIGAWTDLDQARAEDATAVATQSDGSRRGDLSAMLHTPTDDTTPGSQDSADTLGIGDRLKIGFYKHADLTSEVQIRDDGHISIPFLGAIQAAGLDVYQLEQRITRAFEQTTSGSTNVSVHIVERQPFYVIGLVNKPGAYRYQPGMTVLHALASGGGIYRLPATPLRHVDISREVAELRQSTETLKRHLAEHARLSAELAGNAETKPSRRLIDLAGPEKAENLMAMENRLMTQRASPLRRAEVGYERAIKLAKEEIAAMYEQLQRVEEQIKLVRDEKKIIDQLAKKGLNTRSRQLEIRRAVAIVESESRQSIASIKRAEQGLVLAERDQALLILNQRKEIGKELSDLEKKIVENEIAIEKSRSVIQRLGDRQPDVGGAFGELRVTYRILRRIGDKHVETDASETTRIRSGDVLRVTRAPGT